MYVKLIIMHKFMIIGCHCTPGLASCGHGGLVLIDKANIVFLLFWVYTGFCLWCFQFLELNLDWLSIHNIDI